MKELYYKFSDYFRKQGFKGRVHKVTVDAGFSCPNRDGTRSRGGCIYCSNEGFSVHTRAPGLAIEQQIAQGMQALRKRFKAEKFIVYFQAYSNTYASVDQLKRAYDTIKQFPDVAGLAIATRPDCIDEQILALIDSYTAKYDVWIEYGLQSIHNRTLVYINRGHLYEDFLDAVYKTRKFKRIKICAHAIVGLPFETEAMILDTARAIGQLKLDGVKIHPLHVIKGTALETLYRRGEFKPMTRDEYVDLAAKFLEYLWPQTVIQRLTADCPPDLLVAPLWLLEKQRVLSEIERHLAAQHTFQGRRF
ncbi:MAG TPA: TIGR01212 family radical SAM protein [Candidatus Omnitrophota bacterium]|nr:TIGR01212 family radical SAM protein [Candidatus Omnitrophota bacterium]HRZ15498.1 TIGR01212 family radical SAM protein [Candidatus Omnitrophota bacterium]